MQMYRSRNQLYEISDWESNETSTCNTDKSDLTAALPN